VLLVLVEAEDEAEVVLVEAALVLVLVEVDGLVLLLWRVVIFLAHHGELSNRSRTSLQSP